MPSFSPNEIPARIIGRYALHDVLASGGMATVHLGRLLGPVGFSRTVAIKRLHAQFARDPEFVSMFLDEARLAARIRHPNVVPTLDVVATEGELFLVMEYVPGESLSRLAGAAFSAGGRFPLRVIVAIMAGALHGLHAAHEAKSERGEPLGIVHRDVSPQNILVGIDGVARVLDFGVAKAAGRVQTTRDGHIKGKLSYMSPEQLRGDTVTRQADVYAAGIVLWEVLTGQRLFKGDNAGAILLKVLEGKVEPPSRLLNRSTTEATIRAEEMQTLECLDQIALRALDPQSSRRFSTAREFALALERNLPSAPASEVAEWVESVAAQVLATRAEIVAGIESGTMNVPAPQRIMSALHKAAADGKAESGSGTRALETASDPPTTTLAASQSSGSQASALSAAAPIIEHPPSHRGRFLAVAGAILVIGGVVTTGLLVRKSGAAGAPIVPTAADRVPAVETPAPLPEPAPPITNVPDTASAQAAATPAAPTAAPAKGRTRATARPTSAPPPPPDRGVAPPAQPPSPPPAATPASTCAPPYYFDDRGFKHLKPGCV